MARCQPCEGIGEAFDLKAIEQHLQHTAHWLYDPTGPWIQRSFKFQDYDELMAFINAVAWVSRQENHHPDITMSYRDCTIQYQTHALKGITENDFICAKRVNALLYEVDVGDSTEPHQASSEEPALDEVTTPLGMHG